MNAAEILTAAAVAAMPAGVGVYRTIVDGVAPARYVVLHIPDESVSPVTVESTSDAVYVYFHAICVGSDPIPNRADVYCREVTRRLRVAFTDLVISPDGMAPGRVQHEGSNPPQMDESTTVKKVFTQSQFSFRSVLTP